MPTLNANGLRLHYLATGGGAPTLVLVHGAGGSTLTWARQLEGLADRAGVIALDLPGHGGSPGPGRDRIEDYAAVVEGFLAALGRGPVVLGGHSMGGAVTQAVALRAPHLLRGLVLVGTGARLRVLPELFTRLLADYGAGADFLTGLAWSQAAAPALLEGGRRALLATPAAVTVGDFRACDGFDVMARLGEIRLPALVVVGEDDRLTPPRYAEFLARGIPGARLCRIPAAGHFVCLEQPDAVNHAIGRFLEDLPGRG